MNDARRKEVTRVLLLFYGIEGGLSLVALGLFKAHSYTWEALPTKAGVCALVGASVALSSVALLLLWTIRSRGRGGWRVLALALALNTWTLILTLAIEEAVARSIATPTPAGVEIHGLRLLPTWSELVARSRTALTGVNPSGSWDESFLVHDRDLGWTVGANRRDRTGRYFSSVEGIRSAGPDLRVADRKARSRVALVGDSNAFSLEVPYADSWGSQLEQALGPDVQVLNFGVDGYGVDQMLLRYQRDVRAWHPNVVVVGFIGHDLLRSMAVYPFISFEWPGFIVKPRFALEAGKLRRLNAPLPDPEEVLGATDIEDLPYIEYDLGYETYDWRWRLRWSLSPMLLRLYMSRSPRLRVPGPWVSSEATEALNRALFRELRSSIERDGSSAIFVEMSDVGARDSLVDWTLAGTGIDLVDVAPCLVSVPKAERRTASRYHFAGPGNRAVASCTAGPIAEALASSNR